MSDLTSGRYPNVNPEWSIWGQQNNIAQSDVPVYTNAPPGVALTDVTTTVLKTKESTAVPVAVPYGVQLTKVSVRVGATAVGTLTDSWAALYSGLSPATIGGEAEPALLSQAASQKALAMLVTTTISWELEKPVLVTPANAPYGWIYVSVMVAATTAPSLASLLPAAAALTKANSAKKEFPWFVGAPLLPAIRHGSGLSTTAPATIEGALLGVAPAVWLS